MLLEEIYKVNLYIDDNVSIGNNNDGDNKIRWIIINRGGARMMDEELVLEQKSEVWITLNWELLCSIGCCLLNVWWLKYHIEYWFSWFSWFSWLIVSKEEGICGW